MWVRIIYIRNCIKRKAECITTLQGAKLMCMLESGWTNMFHFMTSTCVFLEKCLRSFTYFYNFLFININQLDALNFIISLFHASTCFEHHVLIVRRSKLYYTVSGIITPIGGRPVLSAVLLKIQVFGMWRCFIGRPVIDVSRYRNFFHFHGQAGQEEQPRRKVGCIVISGNTNIILPKDEGIAMFRNVGNYKPKKHCVTSQNTWIIFNKQVSSKCWQNHPPNCTSPLFYCPKNGGSIYVRKFVTFLSN